MPIEVVHQGGALRVEGEVHTLKSLVGPDALGSGGLRLLAASSLDRSTCLLQLSDGSSRKVTVPGMGAGAKAARGAGEAADLVIRNARQILTMASPGVGLLPGAAVACRRGRILAVGEEALERELEPEAQIIDARGGVVTPGLIDPHTHPVFAGERSLEFAMKAEGKGYLEIHAAGGGIFSSMRATRAASFEELCLSCARNLSRLLDWGVTTCEGKSGYALDLEGELRLLEVLRTVSDGHPVDVVPTLLGAHALPPEHEGNRAAYVELVAREMVPRAAEGGLARFCDVFCEEGAFSLEETRIVLEAAKARGLGARLHAEQFHDCGGAILAAELGAASVDHLERLGPRGIEALAGSGTVAVLLPGAALACRCPLPPARELLDAGVPVALGTDLNPGSSMTAALPLMMSLACMQMRMSCEEVWRAVTVEAARSLQLEDVGRLAPGCQADLVVFDAPDYRYIPYHYGDNHARVIIKNGRVVRERGV